MLDSPAGKTYNEIHSQEDMLMPAMPSTRYIFGSLPWYSVLIVLGICAALLLVSREEKRLRLPKDTAIDMALWAIPLGIAGARLYYVAFAWDTFAANPVSILYLWQGGLAIYGGIIGGLLGVFLFSRRRHIRLSTLTDMIVPGLALAQAIGRWGNYFNMEAYGLEVTDPAWQFFPFAVLIPGRGGSVWHMATFFYESVWDMATFAALWLSRKRMKRPGDATLWYFVLYGGGRLMIEGLRLDSLMAGSGSVRISQWLSVLMCLTVPALFSWRALRHAGRRQLLAGGIALGCTAVLTQLLPRPADAFFGYHAAWTLQSLLTLPALVMLSFSRKARAASRLRAMLALAALVFSAALRISLFRMGMSGAESSLLLCAALTLTALCASAAFYLDLPDAHASTRSPQL